MAAVIGVWADVVSVVTVICLHLPGSATHMCTHEIPKPHQVIHNVKIEEGHVMKKRSIDQQMRIRLDYDASVARLPAHKYRLIKDDVIPTAVRYWEDTLKVRQTAAPIRLLRQCQSERVRYIAGDAQHYCVDGCANVTKCGENAVNQKHLEACRICPLGDTCHVDGVSGEGIQSADFMLYVSAVATERCDVGTTVAYAAYCQLEGAMDRPVAGYVNICPESVSTEPHDIHQMHSTLKHEILHALGFSAGLYAFYRDTNGEPLTPRSNATNKPVFNERMQLYQWSSEVVKTVLRPDWLVRSGPVLKEMHMLVTPRVVEEVRKHFNCSSLEGAELEDQGVIGTALTHWEKRVFENEAMTGTYTQNPVISTVTLALMEDTGWYRVNYDKADALSWGRNLGCDFVKRSCLHWMQTRKSRSEHIHPYCDRIKRGHLQTECTESRSAMALCNLLKYDSELPAQYQHFSALPGVADDMLGHYGGSVVLADYCPYIQEFNWKNGDRVVRGSRCNIPENNADVSRNFVAERYGNHSACFDHGVRWRLRYCESTRLVTHWGSGCYRYECQESGLTLFVQDKSYRCYHEGQILNVKVTANGWLHDGTILCPKCSEICKVCPPEVSPPKQYPEYISVPCIATTAALSTLVAMVTSFMVTILVCH